MCILRSLWFNNFISLVYGILQPRKNVMTHIQKLKFDLNNSDVKLNFNRSFERAFSETMPYRSSRIKLSTGGNDGDLSDDSIDHDDEQVPPKKPPVSLRKPPKKNKTMADRLHWAVWDNDCETARDLVINKGTAHPSKR